MRPALLLVAASAIVWLPSQSVAGTIQERNEARVASLLEGRIQGKPVSCVYVQREAQWMEVQYVGLIIKKGSTIYVAPVKDPKTFSTGFELERPHDAFPRNYCHYELTIVFTRTGGGGVNYHQVELGRFVPYTSED